MGMSNVRMASPYQVQAGPRQYHLQDEFGNFEYAYANENSEKMEKGNDMSVRGRYAYIMSDGVLRRVDYIADNNGFHVLQDNADNSLSQNRIKRSVEPDLIQTRMTSFMDSSALRDDAMVNPNVYNMMERDRMNQMSSQRNMYGMMDRSSNMMGRDMSFNTLNRNMIGQQDVYNMRNRNMIGQEMIDEKMMGRNIMGNNVYSNLMGRDMSSNLIGQDMLNRNMMPLGQRNTMSQQMLIEQIPQMTVASRNTFF